MTWDGVFVFPVNGGQRVNFVSIHCVHNLSGQGGLKEPSKTLSTKYYSVGTKGMQSTSLQTVELKHSPYPKTQVAQG